jgi:PKD repeat protein
MAEDDDLDDLEEELAELEEELGDLEEEPEPGDGDGEGLVDRVRTGLPIGDEDEEASAEADDPEAPPEEPPSEPEPEPEPDPVAAEPEEEPPWDREGDAWTAEGEPADDDTVLVRRLDEDGNVVEERRTTEDAVAAGNPSGGDPSRDPGPAPPPDEGEDEDDGGRSLVVLLIVGILILAVVGAGVAYVALSDGGGGIGEAAGPTAQFSRSPTGTVATGSQITFDASASEIPEGAEATYEWEFGDDGTARGATATHAYQSAGTYEVTLTVTANDKRSSTTKEITVAQAPTARISVEVDGSAVGADNPVMNGTEVTFSGADSTGGTINSYGWSIDGTSASGAEVTETFPRPGAKPVELTVTTDQGFTDTASLTVGVGYELGFNDTLPAAVDAASQGPPHNFTVGHDGLVASQVEATLNYTTGTGGPLQDPTPARLNVTDGADQQVASAEGSDGVATVTVSDPGQFVPGTWTGQAEQDQGGAQKSYTLTVRVVYPTG